MLETPQLTGLIQDLRRSTSRIEQLKILTRAWKTVHGLAPAERVELAKHIGMREGLSLLERLGKPGGVSPAALAQAVVKAEQSSPGQLNQILRDLRASSTRSRGIRESVSMLDTVLQQESVGGKTPPVSGAAKPPSQDSSTPPPLPPKTPPSIPLQPESVESDRPRVAAEEAPKTTEAESSGEAAEGFEAATFEVEPTRTAASPMTRDNMPSTVPSAPAESPLVARLETAHNPFYPETPSWGRPFRAPADESTLSPIAAVGAKTAAALMRAFRKLDLLIDTDPRLEERLDSILSEFPQGWPRRRVLSRLIRSGSVSDAAKILSAIASLENPFDEFWCLSAWLHSAEPSRDQLSAALLQTRSAAGKRLLRRRL